MLELYKKLLNNKYMYLVKHKNDINKLDIPLENILIIRSLVLLTDIIKDNTLVN